MRIEYLLSSILATAEKFKKYPKFTKGIYTQMKKLKKKHSVVYEWAIENHEKWRILQELKRFHSFK